MSFLNSNKSQLLRQPSVEVIFCIFVFSIVGYILFYGYLYELAFVVLLAVSVYFVYRFPLLSISLLIISTVLPTIFQMVPEYSEEWMLVGYGIRIQDVLLVSMLGAAILKAVPSNKKQSIQNNLGLTVYVILFGLLICFEIVRNINLYGLSAPGEFRYRYLILAIPIYITLLFSSEKSRLNLLKILIVSSLFFPLICVPIIGMLKGWNIGPENRFYPSSISLGLLYGLLALGLCKKYKIIKINNFFYWPIFSLVIFMLIIDSHRSVWLACFSIVVVLFWIKNFNYSKRVNNTFLIIISIVLILILTNQILKFEMKTNLLDYIVGRTIPLININETHDNTVAWRIAQWRAQMTKLYASPIVGEGFGGYWGFSGMRGDLGVQPHNLYIQTLVKLGIVGMLLYLIIIAKIFVNLKRSLANDKLKSDPNTCLIVIGLVILVASHVFYIAYSFEYYSLLFIGLGVANLQDKKFSIYA